MAFSVEAGQAVLSFIAIVSAVILILAEGTWARVLAAICVIGAAGALAWTLYADYQSDDSPPNDPFPPPTPPTTPTSVAPIPTPSVENPSPASEPTPRPAVSPHPIVANLTIFERPDVILRPTPVVSDGLFSCTAHTTGFERVIEKTTPRMPGVCEFTRLEEGATYVVEVEKRPGLESMSQEYWGSTPISGRGNHSFERGEPLKVLSGDIQSARNITTGERLSVTIPVEYPDKDPNRSGATTNVTCVLTTRDDKERTIATADAGAQSVETTATFSCEFVASPLWPEQVRVGYTVFVEFLVNDVPRWRASDSWWSNIIVDVSPP